MKHVYIYVTGFFLCIAVFSILFGIHSNNIQTFNIRELLRIRFYKKSVTNYKSGIMLRMRSNCMEYLNAILVNLLLILEV